MSRSQVVIVYSPTQGKRRTVIVPEATDPPDWDQTHLPLHLINLLPGEAAMTGPLSQYQTIGPDAMLFAHLGHAPTSDRCIVVSGNAVNGTVVAVIKADPLIDSSPLGLILVDVTGQAVPGLPVVNGVAVLPPSRPQKSSSSSSSLPSSRSSSSSHRAGGSAV